eukprot:TRINITY_DN47334_c0_g1_i1.p1 TRINITY_DN47334_c0_g1~~TRINITY_DN47334_c0_g1_i1.p1  ORF type:complete len:1219 (+),score=402.34 TRINITY_DN47334_c0_g1_i1:78-3659(+)
MGCCASSGGPDDAASVGTPTQARKDSLSGSVIGPGGRRTSLAMYAAEKGRESAASFAPTQPPPSTPPPPPIAEVPSGQADYAGTWLSPGRPALEIEQQPGKGLVLRQPDAAKACELKAADGALKAELGDRQLVFALDKVLQVQERDRGGATVVHEYQLSTSPRPPGKKDPAVRGRSGTEVGSASGRAPSVGPTKSRAPKPPPLPLGPEPPAVAHTGVKWQVGVSLVGGSAMARNFTVTSCDGSDRDRILTSSAKHPGLRVDAAAPYWQPLSFEFLGCDSFKVFTIRNKQSSELAYIPSELDDVLAVLKDKAITLEFDGQAWPFQVKPRTGALQVLDTFSRLTGSAELFGADARWRARGPLPRDDWFDRAFTFSNVRDGSRFVLELREKEICVHGDDRLLHWPAGRAAVGPLSYTVQVSAADAAHDLRRRISERFHLDRLGIGVSSWYLEYGRQPWDESSHVHVTDPELRYKVIPNGRLSPDPGHYTIRMRGRRINVTLGSGQRWPTEALPVGGSSGSLPAKVSNFEIHPETPPEVSRAELLRRFGVPAGKAQGLGFCIKARDGKEHPSLPLSWEAVRDGGSYSVYFKPKTIRVWCDAWEMQRCCAAPDGGVAGCQVVEIDEGDRVVEEIALRFAIPSDLFDLMEKGTPNRQWRVGEMVMVHYDQEEEHAGWYAATVTGSGGPSLYSVRYDDGTVSANVSTQCIHRYVTGSDLEVGNVVDKSEYILVLRSKAISVEGPDADTREHARHCFEGEPPGGGIHPGQTAESALNAIGERFGLMRPVPGGGPEEYETVEGAQVAGEPYCFELRCAHSDSRVRFPSTAWACLCHHGRYEVLLKPKHVLIEYRDGVQPPRLWADFEVGHAASGKHNRQLVQRRYDGPEGTKYLVWRKDDPVQNPVELDWWGVADGGAYCMQPCPKVIVLHGDQRLKGDPHSAARATIEVTPGDSGRAVWKRIASHPAFDLHRLWRSLRLGEPDLAEPLKEAPVATGGRAPVALAPCGQREAVYIPVSQLGFADIDRWGSDLELRLPAKHIKVCDVAAVGTGSPKTVAEFDVLPGQTHEEVQKLVLACYRREIRDSRRLYCIKQRRGEQWSHSDPDSRAGKPSAMSYEAIESRDGFWFDLFRAKIAHFGRQHGGELSAAVPHNKTPEELKRELLDRFRINAASFFLSRDGQTAEELSYDALRHHAFYFVDRA